MKQLAKLITSIAVCFLVAYLGSLVTTPSIAGWYVMLNKPFFSPPNWLFGPVWTALYLLMSISVFLVWKKGINKKTKLPLLLFIAQLFLNYLWSYLFFGLHNPLFAFVDIVLLWTAIYFTIVKFRKISKLASQLLVPYLLWVSFASILNLAIIVLNK